MVRLTEAMVIAKSRMENITQIRNLNMWGNDLTDVSILQSMPNVEVVSLSINRISSLGPFASCRKLVELYLRKNEVSDLDEVVHLQANTRLRILWLGGNPCSQLSNYRLRVIRALPQLQKLDDTDITPQEREQALLIEPPLSKQAVLRPATSPANLIATPSLPPSSTNTAAQNANLSPSTQSPHTASQEGRGSFKIDHSNQALKHLLMALILQTYTIPLSSLTFICTFYANNGVSFIKPTTSSYKSSSAPNYSTDTNGLAHESPAHTTGYPTNCTATLTPTTFCRSGTDNKAGSDTVISISSRIPFSATFALKPRQTVQSAGPPQTNDRAKNKK
ncbi:cilla- and flagella-associated protein [Pelomyxa schiedti]|nr:cilla- and flagella-associated protein [Pelomyxa schiedti]